MSRRVNPEPGCLIPGSHGWRGTAEVVNLAVGYGFAITEMDALLVSAFISGESDDPDLLDVITALSDEAEDWLNVNVAAPDMVYRWHEGEFFYERAEAELEQIDQRLDSMSRHPSMQRRAPEAG